MSASTLQYIVFQLYYAIEAEPAFLPGALSKIIRMDKQREIELKPRKWAREDFINKSDR